MWETTHHDERDGAGEVRADAEPHVLMVDVNIYERILKVTSRGSPLNHGQSRVDAV